MIGQTISHYKITAKLGEGGMGVVYKAEDNRLGRTVALKFLLPHLVTDEATRQRFLREAQAAAALSHSNICTVYGIDDVDGQTFIAMEFVDGPSVADKIKQRPLPAGEGLDIAIQTAEGLQEAHEKGVVHRDIKGSNVLLTNKGQVKITDFGLAHLAQRSRLTKSGTSLGTPSYMSPEQAQNLPTNHRTDIWSLGVMLYEMLTGRLPFGGQYEQAIVYSIINEDPEPATALRTGLPTEVDRVIAKALAKKPDERYQHMDDLLVDLRALRQEPSRYSVPAVAVSPIKTLAPDTVAVRRSRLRALQAVAILAILTVFGLAYVHFSGSAREPAEKPVRRFSIAPEGLLGGSISPDGKYILYAAQRNGRSSLWLRSLDDESAREVPGTAGVMTPNGFSGFWSPDSSSIGFAASGKDGQLKRVSIDGGDPITLCALPAKVPAFFGGTWSPDGERIVFSSGLRLYEIAARGGQPHLLFDPGDSPRPNSVFPDFLPTGGEPPTLVYMASVTARDEWLTVLNLETGERRELGHGTLPVYSPNGYLIHGRDPASGSDRGLWAGPFSLATLQPLGEDFPISATGFAATVSRDGTLAYLDTAGGDANLRTLVWRDRAGKKLEAIGQPQPGMRAPALSPDGQRIAVVADENGSPDIWVHDLGRSSKTRLTFDAESEATLIWSPSGREITYSAGNSIRRKAANGTGQAVVLVESKKSDVGNFDWSRDGRYLFYAEFEHDTGEDILYVPLQPGGGASRLVTFLSTAANEYDPKASPDDRFLAYSSDESGRDEIYIRSFPDGAGKWQASVNGGTQPHWRSDGRELYYVERDALMAVAVSAEPGFSLGQPRQLFESADLSAASDYTSYDVSADGQKFVTITPVESGSEGEATPKLRVVENWYQEFRGREQ